LILRWEDFLRPDRDAPEQSADLEGPQTICNYTSFFVFVKSPATIILSVFLSPVDVAQNH